MRRCCRASTARWTQRKQTTFTCRCESLVDWFRLVDEWLVEQFSVTARLVEAVGALLDAGRPAFCCIYASIWRTLHPFCLPTLPLPQVYAPCLIFPVLGASCVQHFARRCVRAAACMLLLHAAACCCYSQEPCPHGCFMPHAHNKRPILPHLFCRRVCPPIDANPFSPVSQSVSQTATTSHSFTEAQPPTACTAAPTCARAPQHEGGRAGRMRRTPLCCQASPPVRPACLPVVTSLPRTQYDHPGAG